MHTREVDTRKYIYIYIVRTRGKAIIGMALRAIKIHLHLHVSTCTCTSVILDPSYYYISSTVTSSQPVLRESTDSTDDSEGHALFESLTQPSRFDELIIGTQVPCTPGASQVNVLLYLEYFSTCISHYQHVL